MNTLDEYQTIEDKEIENNEYLVTPFERNQIKDLETTKSSYLCSFLNDPESNILTDKVFEIFKNNDIGIKNNIIVNIGNQNHFIEKLNMDGNTVYSYLLDKNSNKKASTYSPIKGFQKNVNSFNKFSFESSSIDIITVSQNFEYLENKKTMKEIIRILKPGGIIILIRNEWNVVKPIMKKLFKLFKKYSPNNYDIKKYSYKEIASLFLNYKISMYIINNYKEIDFKKYIISIKSYLLNQTIKNFDKIFDKFIEVFNCHKENESINYDYDTIIYIIHNDKLE